MFGILAAKGPTVSRETERQVWVDAWARRIDALGLSPIVLPLVDIAHTFGFLGSQALLIAQPLAASIVNETTIERAAALLDSPELLEQLRVCLQGEES
jgi:hypothetical protein